MQTSGSFKKDRGCTGLVGGRFSQLERIRLKPTARKKLEEDKELVSDFKSGR